MSMVNLMNDTVLFGMCWSMDLMNGCLDLFVNDGDGTSRNSLKLDRYPEKIPLVW